MGWIDGLEGLLVGVSGLCSLAVAGGVVLVSERFPGGLRSGVPAVAVESDITTERWLAARRPRPVLCSLKVVPDPSWEDLRSEAGGLSSAPSVGAVSSGTQGWGGPWASSLAWGRAYGERRVGYGSARGAPGLSSLMAIAAGVEWRRVEVDPGLEGYELTRLEWRSPLRSRLGLRQGDRIVAINGLRVFGPEASGSALYDRLRGAEWLSLLIERGGRPALFRFHLRASSGSED